MLGAVVSVIVFQRLNPSQMVFDYALLISSSQPKPFVFQQVSKIGLAKVRWSGRYEMAVPANVRRVFHRNEAVGSDATSLICAFEDATIDLVEIATEDPF